jgi:hypothetical protein
MRTFAMWLALVLCACGSDRDTSDGDRLALQRAVVATTSEVNLHWATIMNAGDLADVRAEAERHTAVIAAALADVRARLDVCGGERMMAPVEAIEQDHELRMSQAEDLAAIRAECDAYARTMGETLHVMMGMECVP